MSGFLFTHTCSRFIFCPNKVNYLLFYYPYRSLASGWQAVATSIEVEADLHKQVHLYLQYLCLPFKLMSWVFSGEISQECLVLCRNVHNLSMLKLDDFWLSYWVLFISPLPVKPGGDYRFPLHPSVCPSVRLSVSRSVHPLSFPDFSQPCFDEFE